jgi:hypothetical protein
MCERARARDAFVLLVEVVVEVRRLEVWFVGDVVDLWVLVMRMHWEWGHDSCYA